MFYRVIYYLTASGRFDFSTTRISDQRFCDDNAPVASIDNSSENVAWES